jgi:hypothetical protein
MAHNHRRPVSASYADKKLRDPDTADDEYAHLTSYMSDAPVPTLSQAKKNPPANEMNSL